jgi:hypothetical protein
MRHVLLLAEAVSDLEAARDFYNARENGAGEYCVEALLADVEKLNKLHGIHRMQFGCYRMLATRFPFGIYYRESGLDTQVVGILDLRRDPGWIFHQITQRLD